MYGYWLWACMFCVIIYSVHCYDYYCYSIESCPFMCHGVCADVVFAVWVPLFQYDDCHLLLDKFFVESEWMSEFLENVIYLFVSIVHNLWFDDLWWCCSFYVITLLWFVPKCHWVWVFDDFIRCSLFCFVLFESFDKHTMDKISAAIAMNNRV